MKLKDALKDINTNVKVGAAVGFFYCGSAKELVEGLNDISAEIKDNWKMFGDRMITEVVRTKNYSWYDYLADQARQYRDTGKGPDFTKAGFEKKKAAMEKQADRNLENAMAYYKYHRHFVSLGNRNVLDIYDSVDDETKIIIIQGAERGRFWTIGEEEQWRKKKSKGARILAPTSGAFDIKAEKKEAV